MRNPFRRRRRLPRAAADWDESQHVPLAGGEYVAIPEDQLPTSAIERLAGVTLYRTDEGSAVFVNIDAVEAEVDERSAALSEELTERAIARFGEGDLDDPEYRAQLEAAADADKESPEVQHRMREITEAAFNNTDNWVKGGGDEMADDDTRYALMRVNLVSGRIERPGMPEAAEEDDLSPRTRSSEGSDPDALITAVEDALDANWGSPLAQEWQSLPGDYAELAEGITHSSDAGWAPFLKCFLSGRTLRMLEVDRGEAAALPPDLVTQARALDPYREAAEMLRTIKAAGERISEFFAPGADTWDALADWASVSSQLEFGRLRVNARAAFEFGYVMRCFEETRQG